MKQSILIFIFLLFSSGVLRAQFSPSDSLQDRQILNLIHSGVYSTKKASLRGPFGIGIPEVDSIYYTVLDDSIIATTIDISIDSLPRYSGKIIYTLRGKRVRCESGNPDRKEPRTIINYDERGNQVNEYTNTDDEYYKNYAKKGYKDTLFLKANYSYDNDGNLLHFQRMKRDGSVDVEMEYKYFHLGTHTFLVQSDYLNKVFPGSKAMNSAIPNRKKYYGVIDTTKRTKVTTTLSYSNRDKDSVSVTKGMYFYDSNWNNIREEEYDANGKLLFVRTIFNDARGNDTLTETRVMPTATKVGSKNISRTTYDSKGQEIWHEHCVNGIRDNFNIKAYDNEGRLILDSSGSDNAIDRLLSTLIGDQNTWSYDVHGNLTEQDTYRNGRLVDSYTYTYYYRK